MFGPDRQPPARNFLIGNCQFFDNCPGNEIHYEKKLPPTSLNLIVIDRSAFGETLTR